MKEQTKAPLDYVKRAEYCEYPRRLRHKSTVKELLAWVGILISVAGIIAVLAYTAYVTDHDIREARHRAKAGETLQVPSSWETKEARQ